MKYESGYFILSVGKMTYFLSKLNKCRAHVFFDSLLFFYHCFFFFFIIYVYIYNNNGKGVFVNIFLCLIYIFYLSFSYFIIFHIFQIWLEGDFCFYHEFKGQWKEGDFCFYHKFKKQWKCFLYFGGGKCDKCQNSINIQNKSSI